MLRIVCLEFVIVITCHRLLILSHVLYCTVGKSMDNYVMHLAQDGILTGYRPVVFNQRGNGGLYLKVSTRQPDHPAAD